MKLPIRWLKDYVDVDCSMEDLAKKLFSAGFEVEEIQYLGAGIDKVVVAKILTMDKHPDADRLKICRVDAGEYGIRQIVTAAPNVKAGDVIPLALDGARLPDGTVIHNGKLRGAESQGMMCGGSELGIDDANYPGASVDGVLILRPEDAPLGTDIRKVIGLDEYIFDISLTANRPDCQSVFGMAREVAAILGKPLKFPDVTVRDLPEKPVKGLSVDVRAKDLCRRYMAAKIGSVQIAPSPEWMRKRLVLAGLRPINNFVDITNFVLLELGNPMHAFDEREISGGKIVARCAAPGETLVTLDGKENVLSPEMLVICDEERPLAVAGIMGGKESGIRPDTRSVVFEVAKFARDSIRKTSRKLGLRSDSSARFEKGVDSASCAFAMQRALHLVQELGAGTVEGAVIDCCFAALEPKEMTVSLDHIDALLGIPVPEETVCDILRRLSFGVRQEGRSMHLTVPLYREDIDGEPDIAEEVIRYYGYEHIVPTLLDAAETTNGGMSDRQKGFAKLKEILIACGMNECITYSFVNEKWYDWAKLSDLKADAVRILNPISEDAALMRRKIFPSLLHVASANLSKKVSEGRLFELARVYDRTEGQELPCETETLSLCNFGNTDFFEMKGQIENVLDAFGLRYELRRSRAPYLHPGISADIVARGQVIGCFGEVHPDVAEAFGIRQKVYVAECSAEKILAFEDRKFVYRDIPVYQSITRDLAFVVKEDIPAAEIVREIRRAAGKLLEDVSVFDVYRGANIDAGCVSLAFKLVFRAKDRTLKYDDVNAEIEAIMKAVSAKFHIRLREQ